MRLEVMNWLLVLGTLLGTAIGAAGTIVSQHVAGRSLERRERLVRAAERRTELRTAVEGYLEIYQEMERATADGDERSSELSHRMWFLHNRLALIAPPGITGPLGDLADRLNRAYWKGPPDGELVWDYLHEPWSRFRDAAHAELVALEPPAR
ncbi:hypothetical protein ACIBCH_34685 [Amycolatopsis thailandensis]|uniref:hypothetical protein n=1 Tax=Amycolatopsis thailandensis TaxID=589330 RepID=UPI0037A78B0E